MKSPEIWHIRRAASSAMLVALWVALVACGDDGPSAGAPEGSAPDVESDAEAPGDAQEPERGPEVRGGQPDSDSASPPADAAPEPREPDADVPAPPDGGEGTSTEDDASVEPDAADPADATRVEPDGQDPGADPPGPPPCSPPLSVSPAEVFARPYELVAFKGAGGTGAYTWSLAASPSGASISSLLGAYLAGGAAGTEDLVRLEDHGCAGQAEALVRVVPPLQVGPASAELPPGTALVLQIHGGSGDRALEWVQEESGGSLDSLGVYIAGPTPGTDVVRVRDLGTQESVSVVFVVDPDAALTVTPPRVLLAEGSEYAIQVEGGSGAYVFEVASEAIATTDGGGVQGHAAGGTTLHVLDIFTGLTAEVPVQVAASAQAPLVRAGDRTLWTRLVPAGDLDGDGIDDLVVGHREADIGWFNDGAVYVYRGQPEGPPVLAQVFAGESRRAGFGWDVAVADVVGPDAVNKAPDGIPDLIVGSPALTTSVSTAGRVYVYPGRPAEAGGLFAPDPVLVYSGQFSGDELGFGLAVCDFNGDGRPDLAIGGHGQANRDLTPVPARQGGVRIYLGFADGLLAEPQQVVWGKTPNSAGQWVDTPDLRLGREVRAGDVNGDGLCDLVVSALDGSDGAVFVYPGVAAEGSAVGGVSPHPLRAWTGGQPAYETTSQLGRRLAVGDVNGDGYADLLIAQHAHDTPTLNNNGAARLVLGGPWPAPAEAAWLPSDAVDWTHEGPASSDVYGLGVDLGDVNGDGLLDLLIGDYNARSPLNNARTGVARVFYGQADGLPAAAPDLEVAHTQADLRLATAFTVLPSAKPDAPPDWILHAAFDHALGPNVGQVYALPGGTPELEQWHALDWPAEPAGTQLGFRVDFIADWTGNGHPDLVVGAPFEDRLDTGVNSGVVYVYEGSAEGFSTEPHTTLAGFDRHTTDIRFGYDVADIGDFDGDGHSDLAVVSLRASKPGTLSANIYSLDAACQGARSTAGAVYVFRGGQQGEAALTPDFLIYGPQASMLISAVARGGVDVNGDGLADLVYSGNSWNAPGANNAGGVAVAFGRSEHEPDRIRVICAPDFIAYGVSASDAMGRTPPAALGDLDGDGCDELAVGAEGEGQGKNNQGGVWIVAGWGGPACPDHPRVLHLLSDTANARGGYAIAGRGDVDGDGLPDLLVGGPTFPVAGVGTGAAWVLRGHNLAALPFSPFTGDRFTAAYPAYPFAPPGAAGVQAITGTEPGERFGQAVAWLPGYGPQGRDAVLVGGPLGAAGGHSLSGGARAYAFHPGQGGFHPRPLLAFGGETHRPAGRLGEALATRRHPTAALLAISGYDGSGYGLDDGSAYAFRLPLPAP